MYATRVLRALQRQYLLRTPALVNGNLCRHPEPALKRRYGGVRLYTESSSRSQEPDDADEVFVRQDVGEYDMIWPNLEDSPETVAALPRRPVPSHIIRPPYATPGGVRLFREKQETADDSSGDGLIPLGGEDEVRLRAAALLAARVLQSVGQRIAEKVSRQNGRCVSC